MERGQHPEYTFRRHEHFEFNDKKVDKKKRNSIQKAATKSHDDLMAYRSQLKEITKELEKQLEHLQGKTISVNSTRAVLRYGGNYRLLTISTDTVGSTNGVLLDLALFNTAELHHPDDEGSFENVFEIVMRIHTNPDITRHNPNNLSVVYVPIDDIQGPITLVKDGSS